MARRFVPNNKNINLLQERLARKTEREKQLETVRLQELAVDNGLKKANARLRKPSRPTRLSDDDLESYFRSRDQLRVCPYPEYRGISVGRALSLVSEHRMSWIRKPIDFKPRLYNAERQFSLLVRHLYAKYKVPAFMDSCWFAPEKQWYYWFITVAQGGNIRKCNDMPVKLTKKMAHEMMNAPSNYTIEQAIRYGQIMGMGGERRLVNAILTTDFGRSFQYEEFWGTVFQWLVNSPMIDTNQVAPIIDYIRHKKTQEPEYSMKGRTVDAMIRQMTIWHEGIKKEQGKKYSEWKASDINGFKYTEGQDTNKKDWLIVEILNSKDLKEEGKKLHHCVYSYEGSCKSRRIAIFSLSCNGEKLITIEVGLSGHNISQMRGLHNRTVLPRERRIIMAWASKNNLVISKYI